MRNILLLSVTLITMTLATIGMTSCTKKISLPTPTSLSGTVWRDSKLSTYSFTTTQVTETLYDRPTGQTYAGRSGTYTYSDGKGEIIFSDGTTVEFTVSSNKLTAQGVVYTIE